MPSIPYPIGSERNHSIVRPQRKAIVRMEKGLYPIIPTHPLRFTKVQSNQASPILSFTLRFTKVQSSKPHSFLIELIEATFDSYIGKSLIYHISLNRHRYNAFMLLYTPDTSEKSYSFYSFLALLPTRVVSSEESHLLIIV